MNQLSEMTTTPSLEAKVDQEPAAPMRSERRYTSDRLMVIRAQAHAGALYSTNQSDRLASLMPEYDSDSSPVVRKTYTARDFKNYQPAVALATSEHYA